MIWGYPYDLGNRDTILKDKRGQRTGGPSRVGPSRVAPSLLQPDEALAPQTCQASSVEQRICDSKKLTCRGSKLKARA